jgi:hypothetical protein
MTGRPSLLTPELQAQIIAHVEAGNYRSTSAAAVGIHRNTLTNWEKWGEEGRAPYADFLCALRIAEAKAEIALLAEIRSARAGVVGVSGADVWTNLAWIMERRYGGRWCARVKQQTAENVEALTSKLKADPELHKRVTDVLAGEEPPATSAGNSH